MSNAVTMPSMATAPGVFTADSSGKGQGAILNQDGTPIGPANPAAPGTIVTLFVISGGQTDPPGVDGKLTDGLLPKPLAPVSVSIGGSEAEILYAGAAPALVAGVLQINARLPEELRAGDQPVVVTIGTESSPALVTVAVR